MLTIVLALALSGPMQGQPAAKSAPKPNDPQMIADYEALVAFVQKTPRFSVEAIKTDQDDDGHLEKMHYAFRLERPGRFRLEVRPDERHTPALIVVSDGKTVTTYHAPRNIYSESPFQDVLSALDEDVVVARALSGSLVDTLLRSDLVPIIRERVTDGALVGTETVDGRSLRHYRLRWRGDAEELWIGPDAEPLLRKLVRTQVIPEAGGKSSQIVTTTALSWTVGGPTPEGAFTMKLPPQARKVDDIADALMELENEPTPVPTPTPAPTEKPSGPAATPKP